MPEEDQGDDVLEQGGSRFRLPSWRPSKAAEIVAVAALIAGLAAGYAAGHSRGGGGAPRPGPTVTVTAPPSAAVPAPSVSFSIVNSLVLGQDAGACSQQDGTQLQLGVQVTNQSAGGLLLQTARAVLPLGGLKPVSWRWGPCGLLPGPAGSDPAHPAYLILAASGSVWLTFTFQVKLRCPGPLPVQFSVGYDLQGQEGTASLPGFADLSQVPYAGCA